MVQLSATMEQTRETQLAQLYDVLGFRRVIARYDVLSTRHETGPWLPSKLYQAARKARGQLGHSNVCVVEIFATIVFFG